ncbi:MAG: DNA topoisomerase IV, partial [Sulfurimonas sp.]|nr:DNA topoisomerase IV [Sulfurimonas sp.]
LELDEEVETEEDSDKELELDEEVELNEELELDEEVETEEDSDEELELDEEVETEENSDEELELDEEVETEENLEAQIQSAVEELSDEDLDSIVDEETLLKIATSEIDSIDALNTRELKLAIGEEVDLEELDEVSQSDEIESLVETNLDTTCDEELENQEQIENENDGVEALKKLLKALSDKDVAASLKGMKININITLGNN